MSPHYPALIICGSAACVLLLFAILFKFLRRYRLDQEQYRYQGRRQQARQRNYTRFSGIYPPVFYSHPLATLDPTPIQSPDPAYESKKVKVEDALKQHVRRWEKDGKDIEEDWVCCICLEGEVSDEKEEVVLELRCGHILHKECTRKLMLGITSGGKRCPLCNTGFA